MPQLPLQMPQQVTDLVAMAPDLVRTYVPLVLLAMNAVAFAAFGIDKRRAIRGEWRIPEATLLTLSLLGGAAGALAGMVLFRHKTLKPKFFVLVPCMLVAQAAFAGWAISLLA